MSIQQLLTREQFKLWTDALRSGKYRQGNGQLKKKYADNESLYCCLGVLNEVCDLRNVKSSCFLRSDAMIFDDTTAIAIPKAMQQDLANMNDFRDSDFNKIADYIESDLIPLYPFAEEQS